MPVVEGVKGAKKVADNTPDRKNTPNTSKTDKMEGGENQKPANESGNDKKTTNEKDKTEGENTSKEKNPSDETEGRKVTREDNGQKTGSGVETSGEVKETKIENIEKVQETIPWWKQGIPMSQIKYTISSNAKLHLIDSKTLVSGKRGVIGTHNKENFYKKLKDMGKDMEQMIDTQDIIIDKNFSGLETIKYKIPKGNGKGVYLDEYKYASDPKTVYDPQIYSDDQIYSWGLEAMKNGYLDEYLICGEASNGMKFMGYFRNGEISNFHPVTSFDE